MSDSAGRWVSLGEPLDHLLNRNSKRGGDVGPRGIILPDEKSPGSGNIVICGKAGSGKSTLALQIAHACTRDGYAAGYISLEESPEGVRTKAEGFGWADKLCEVRHMHLVDEAASPKELGRILTHILAKPRAEDDKPKCLLEMGSEPPQIPDAQEAPGQEQECPLREDHKERFQRLQLDDKQQEEGEKPAWAPCILLFSLSPASLVAVREEGALFQERYRQLERLLAAASWLNEKAHEKRRARKNPQGAAAGPDPEKPEPWPSLPLVCVDSLNVFGTGEPVREEYHRLFDLFHRHRIIGVFTVEASTETPFDSTMTDVVINLTEDKDEGYFVRYLEVEKSRYIPQAYGRHTFKIL
ncbi:MAG: hypothetical protein NTX87_09605 [Planctomycetota bacterium]|nr:hypothetical protein [Planctomycetota bacterium]